MSLSKGGLKGLCVQVGGRLRGTEGRGRPTSEATGEHLLLAWLGADEGAGQQVPGESRAGRILKCW